MIFEEKWSWCARVQELNQIQEQAGKAKEEMKNIGQEVKKLDIDVPKAQNDLQATQGQIDNLSESIKQLEYNTEVVSCCFCSYEQLLTKNYGLRLHCIHFCSLCLFDNHLETEPLCYIPSFLFSFLLHLYIRKAVLCNSPDLGIAWMSFHYEWYFENVLIVDDCQRKPAIEGARVWISSMCI